MISEWLNELDEVSFEAEGLPCRMARGSSGAWCGYVGIPSTHPWFGKHYDMALPVISIATNPMLSQNANTLLNN